MVAGRQLVPGVVVGLAREAVAAVGSSLSSICQDTYCPPVRDRYVLLIRRAWYTWLTIPGFLYVAGTFAIS